MNDSKSLLKSACHSKTTPPKSAASTYLADKHFAKALRELENYKLGTHGRLCKMISAPLRREA